MTLQLTVKLLFSDATLLLRTLTAYYIEANHQSPTDGPLASTKVVTPNKPLKQGSLISLIIR